MASLGNFFDAVDVYSDDLDSLGPGGWLRTNIVAYWLLKLQTAFNALSASPEKQQQGCGGGDERLAKKSPKPELAQIRLFCLDPSIAQAMCFFGDASIGPEENMKNSNVLLVPIADYSSQTADGSHWSLLVFVRGGMDDPKLDAAWTVVHCDSSAGLNGKRAKKMLEVLNSTLASTTSASGELPALVESPCFPQQPNGYDCGVFLCLAAQEIFNVVVHCQRVGAVTGLPPLFNLRKKLLGPLFKHSGVAEKPTGNSLAGEWTFMRSPTTPGSSQVKPVYRPDLFRTALIEEISDASKELKNARLSGKKTKDEREKERAAAMELFLKEQKKAFEDIFQ